MGRAWTVNVVEYVSNCFLVLEEGNGSLLPCSFLENPMVRGMWWVTDRGVAMRWT